MVRGTMTGQGSASGLRRKYRMTGVLAALLSLCAGEAALARDLVFNAEAPCLTAVSTGTIARADIRLKRKDEVIHGRVTVRFNDSKTDYRVNLECAPMADGQSIDCDIPCAGGLSLMLADRGEAGLSGEMSVDPMLFSGTKGTDGKRETLVVTADAAQCAKPAGTSGG